MSVSPVVLSDLDLDQGFTLPPEPLVHKPLSVYADQPLPENVIQISIKIRDGLPEMDLVEIQNALANAQLLTKSMRNVPQELATAIVQELMNPTYNGRSHYARNTYAKGCRGQLCTARENHVQHQIRIAKALRDDRWDDYMLRMSRVAKAPRKTLTRRELNSAIAAMLTASGREVPEYLQLLVRDPYMRDSEAWKKLAAKRTARGPYSDDMKGLKI